MAFSNLTALLSGHPSILEIPGVLYRNGTDTLFRAADKSEKDSMLHLDFRDFLLLFNGFLAGMVYAVVMYYILKNIVKWRRRRREDGLRQIENRYKMRRDNWHNQSFKKKKRRMMDDRDSEESHKSGENDDDDHVMERQNSQTREGRPRSRSKPSKETPTKRTLNSQWV